MLNDNPLTIKGPPHTVNDDDVKLLFPNAELKETEDDCSSIDRLGLVVQNIYSITL